jgi:hypothetical protein
MQKQSRVDVVDRMREQNLGGLRTMWRAEHEAGRRGGSAKRRDGGKSLSLRGGGFVDHVENESTEAFPNDRARYLTEDPECRFLA